MMTEPKKTQRLALGILIIVGGLAALGYWYSTHKKTFGNGDPVVLTFPDTCLETTTVADTNSYRRYIQNMPGEMATSVEIDGVIKAESIEYTAFGPIPSVSNYVVDEKPLLWVKTDRLHLVLDQKYFSDFSVVDTARLPSGKEQTIGTVSPALLSALDPKSIGQFLLRSEIIDTYAQEKADICLVSEETTETWYRAEFDVIHTYHTNKTNQELYPFNLSINIKNGDVLLFAPPKE